MQIRILEGFSIAAIQPAWHSLFVGLVLEVRSEDDSEVLASLQANKSLGACGPMVEILGGEHWDKGFYAIRGQHLLDVLVVMSAHVPGLDDVVSWLVNYRPGISDGWLLVCQSHAQEVGNFPPITEASPS